MLYLTHTHMLQTYMHMQYVHICNAYTTRNVYTFKVTRAFGAARVHISLHAPVPQPKPYVVR